MLSGKLRKRGNGMLARYEWTHLLRCLLIVFWTGLLLWFGYSWLSGDFKSESSTLLLGLPLFSIANLVCLGLCEPKARPLLGGRLFRLASLWLDVKESDLRARSKTEISN
jgi:hypothetical protein